MEKLRGIFFKVLIVSIAVSVAIGVAVALFGAYQRGGRVFLTSLTITIAAVSMFVNGILLEKLIGKILPYVGFALTPICAVLCIALVWDGVDEEPVVTALTLLAANFFMLPFAIYHKKRGGLTLPILGVAATVVSAGYIILMFWDIRSENLVWEKIALTAWALAIVSFYLALILLVRLGRRFEWSRMAVSVSAWAAFALLAFVFWFVPRGTTLPEWAGRAAIIISIFIAALTVLIPVFYFLDRFKTSSTGSIQQIDAEIEKLKLEIEKLESKKTELAQAGKSD